ncbi:MAG: hypothetical protein JST40_02930 [Armatimonadetes bacterium]|nr:hypothetical protein [Armatimonadota bacterium]
MNQVKAGLPDTIDTEDLYKVISAANGPLNAQQAARVFSDSVYCTNYGSVATAYCLPAFLTMGYTGEGATHYGVLLEDFQSTFITTNVLINHETILPPIQGADAAAIRYCLIWLLYSDIETIEGLWAGAEGVPIVCAVDPYELAERLSAIGNLSVLLKRGRDLIDLGHVSSLRKEDFEQILLPCWSIGKYTDASADLQSLISQVDTYLFEERLWAPDLDFKALHGEDVWRQVNIMLAVQDLAQYTAIAS